MMPTEQKALTGLSWNLSELQKIYDQRLDEEKRVIAEAQELKKVTTGGVGPTDVGSLNRVKTLGLAEEDVELLLRLLALTLSTEKKKIKINI